MGFFPITHNLNCSPGAAAEEAEFVPSITAACCKWPELHLPGIEFSRSEEQAMLRAKFNEQAGGSSVFIDPHIARRNVRATTEGQLRYILNKLC